MSNYILRKSIKLKTGFFESEEYILIITRDSLRFVSEGDSNKEYKIKYSNIKALNLSMRFSTEIEVQTDERVFIATLSKTEKVDDLIRLFSEILSNKFKIV